ncbi:MAG: hypothetical protein GY769_04775, partial [bacterium]|nr:hypothetical protein [bacterium]
MSRAVRASLPVVLALFTAGVVLGQDVPSGLVGPPLLQFSFSNPGARSLGFGGAFVALADDATAAFANPAGLVLIAEPEVSLEGRSRSYSTPFTNRGRLENEPSGYGVDVIAGLQQGTSSADLSGVSFVAFVYPRGDGSIAFYRHQLADFESGTQTNGIFSGGTTCCQIRHIEVRTRTDLEIVSYGLSGAYRVSDKLSFGLSLVYFDSASEITGEPFLPDVDPVLGAFAPTSYRPERQALQTTILIDDTDVGFTGGFLSALSPRWRVGGFYRQGPALTLDGEAVVGPSGDFFGLTPGALLDQATSPIAFPDVYGLGFSFRPYERLTLAFEWDRVEYSTILDSVDQVEFGTDNVVLEDDVELHLGAEYVFLGTTPVAALRLGVWLDP